MNKEIMKKLGFNAEVEDVAKGQCPFCGKIVNNNEFRDALSRREFTISGLCQSCQDETFE